MQSSIKLISVNIELSNHLHLVAPFIGGQDPDVVCFQELCERDIPFLEKELSLTSAVFARTSHETLPHETVVEGIGIFSKFPARRSKIDYYVGTADHIPETALADSSTYELGNRVLVSADFEHAGAIFSIATTHFTWSPQGLVSERQRRDLRMLLGLLEEKREFVLTGDFNAPRGGEIFSALARRYTDNIPSRYKTSLDLNLHRAGKTRPRELADKMVDGLFTTPAYAASNVHLVSGVSDHCAIVANITKV